MVVTSTDLWADVVSNVLCGDVTVEHLIPGGGDPHLDEMSLDNRATLDDASAVVITSASLEAGIADAAGDGDEGRLFEWLEHVDALEGEDGHGDETHADESHDDHDHDGADPHVWFDPARVSAAIPDLADFLIEQLDLDPTEVEACAATYRDELDRTDATMTQTLDVVPPADRLLITNHDSLRYFANRFGFDVVATILEGNSTSSETSARHLAEVSELMADRGINAIFVDHGHAGSDAEAVAATVDGAEVVELFSGSLGEPGTGAETYLGFLTINAQRVADGLSG
jgi:ABC-type Zn uptake system ZnuABC Zn-binding protein ZnuA